MRPPVGPSLFGGCCCRAPAYWLNSLARHALASSPHLSSPTLSHLSLACGHDVALWEFDARNPRRDAPSARSGPVRQRDANVGCACDDSLETRGGRRRPAASGPSRSRIGPVAHRPSRRARAPSLLRPRTSGTRVWVCAPGRRRPEVTGYRYAIFPVRLRASRELSALRAAQRPGARQTCVSRTRGADARV